MYVHQVLKRDAVLFTKDSFPVNLLRVGLIAITETTKKNCNTYSRVQQKSIGLKFSKSRTGSDVRYSCHHNSSRFTFPIFAHSCRFSVHSLQSITPRIYTVSEKDCSLFLFFFLGAQCVESGVSCTDCY